VKQRHVVSFLIALGSGLAFAADLDPQQDKAQFDPWGFDLRGRDQTVKPGDDFFRYANGTWLDNTVIAPDKTGVSLRLKMTDAIEERLHRLLEAAAAQSVHEPKDLTGKAGAFYRSFLDEARVEQVGAKPLATAITAVQRASNRDALAALTGHSNVDFSSALFNVFIDVDLKDPNHYAVYLGQSGLGLPDRDYYLQASFAKTKAEYQTYAGKMLRLLNWPKPDESAQALVEFETEIAKVSWTKTQQRDLNAVYNPMSIDDLEKFAPGFAWRAYLQKANLGSAKQVVISEKSAFPRIASIYQHTSLDTLRAWQAFHIVDKAAPYLAAIFVTAHFELHSKALAGQKEVPVRWKRAITAVGGGDFASGGGFGVFGTMGFGVGQLYTEVYFPPSAKTKIEELVGNLKSAYRVRIEKLDWMSAATKIEALKKLDTYRIKVGYPDHPRDYTNVDIRDDDLVANVLACAAADWLHQTARLNSPVDRDDWLLTPQTNNAYNGSLRDIVFPAGILQPPIFDPNADAAINYGAIGGVIGHELTHGFDDQGRKIDAAGALRDWWTADDATKFETRAKQLAGQYSNFEPLPNVHVNGELTMGENIADLGGLMLGLDAYHTSLKGKPAPVLDGVTGDQRVLLGWAQAWRGKVTDTFVTQQVINDPHSPRQFRVNGVVRNLDAWYQAFGIQQDDKLFVAPENRVRIW
jgi:putative endopeptidase